MLELTVKTLDSQNHSYSVPDDITVRQFKEKISVSVRVPADKQRLIYCGRVLQDSKKLSEYDVNGKVIHLVQRPPPQATQPSASTSSTTTGAQSTSTTSTTTTAGGQFGRMPRDGNSFLLGAFTIPSDVTEPNHVQQIVQRIVSGMGELGRNATVMSRTSDDGSSVDVHINLGQVPTQREGRQMYKQGVHMYKMANQSLDRLENFMKNRQSSEATVAAASSMEQGATAAAGAAAEASGSSASTSDATMQEMETSASQSGPSKASTDEEIPGPEASSVPRKAPSPQPCSSSSPDAEVTSTEVGEGQNGAAAANQAPSDPRTRDSESRNAQRGSQDARPCRTRLLASLLQDLNRLQIRLQPHLERYQQYLSLVDGQLTGSELENAQQTYNSVSEIMHYLSHAYHAVSELVVNFVQCPECNLLAYPPNIQTPAAVSIQAQINVSTSTSPNNTQPSSPDHTTASAASSTPTTTASSTNAAASSSTEWGQDGPEIEISSGSLIDSLSATMMGAEATSTGAAESGRQGIYVPAPPDFLQSLLQRLGNASTQRATMIVVDANGQTQARGNTATNTTTSTQTRSTARPAMQRIPMVLPGFGLSSSFDRFLPCSSRHVISRQPLASMSRDDGGAATADGTPNQGAQGTNIPADAQLTGVITNLMSALLSQSGASSSSSTGGSENRPSTERPASENQQQQQPPPRQPAAQSSTANAIWDSLIRSAMISHSSTSGLQTASNASSSGGSSSSSSAAAAAAASTASGPDVMHRFLQLFNTLPFQDLLGAMYGRPEPLNRMQGVLRPFVQQTLLQNREPTDENVQTAVEEVVEMLKDFLVAISQEANVRENIDFVATLNNVIRTRLREFIRLIVTDSDSFGVSFHRLWGVVMHEMIALNVACFEDGQQSLERIAQTFVRAISQYTNNQLASTLAELCTMNIRSMVAFVNLNDSQVEHYIVRTTTTDPGRSDQLVPVAEETETNASASDSNITNIVHEPMDMDSASEPLSMGNESSRPAVGSSGITSNGADDCNGASAMWRDVPVEWVPIITKDVQRQRRQAAQPPFSDAYAEGMPSKRRKMMTSQKVQTSTEARSSLDDILRRSIVGAGVQPFTSMDEVTRTLSENDTLQDAYADQLKKAVRRRLQSDRDYHPRRFPNSEKFFFSENDDGNNK